MLKRPVEVEVAEGPLDQSETKALRQLVLDPQNSELKAQELRIRAIESKTNRIWYILTVVGFLAWAWIDGRFGLKAPNAVPITGNGTVAAEVDTDGIQVLTNQER